MKWDIIKLISWIYLIIIGLLTFGYYAINMIPTSVILISFLIDMAYGYGRYNIRNQAVGSDTLRNMGLIFISIIYIWILTSMIPPLFERLLFMILGVSNLMIIISSELYE